MCKNNKDYMSVGIGYVYFSQMYLIVFNYVKKKYCIYLIARPTMVTVGLIPLSVNILISLFGGEKHRLYASVLFIWCITYINTALRTCYNIIN